MFDSLPSRREKVEAGPSRGGKAQNDTEVSLTGLNHQESINESKRRLESFKRCLRNNT
jgi:hypothetical protein